MERMDLRSLDLNLLVALDRLLDRRSVTLAAKDLGLSQPATSRALQRLREALADPVLVQVGREMVPTERALALVGPAEDALQAIRNVFAVPAPFDPATADGAFAIAMGDETQLVFADAIAVAVWAQAPGIDLRFRGLTVESAVAGRRGELDLALVPDLASLPAKGPPVDLSDYVARPMYTRRFVVAQAAGSAPLDLDGFCASKHVLVSFDGTGHGFVDDLLADVGRRRRVAATVGSFQAAARLVAASDLVGTLPSEVVTTAGVPLDSAPPPLAVPDLPMHLLWHPRVTADPRHRFVRERVADAIRACLPP